MSGVCGHLAESSRKRPGCSLLVQKAACADSPGQKEWSTNSATTTIRIESALPGSRTGVSVAVRSSRTDSISVQGSAQSNRGAMAVLTILFFLCGFLAALNDILIPHLKPIFELNYAEAMLVQFSFFSAFLLFAVPSGKLIEHIGYKRTMVVGLLTMSFGAFLFIPAADIPSFPIFMFALMVLAAGITSLQVSGNPYVAVLGPSNTASSRLLLTQAFNSLGSTIAPYFGGLLILSAAPKSTDQLRRMSTAVLQSYRLQQAAHVKTPYIVIAITLFVLGMVIAGYRLPAMRAEHKSAFKKGAPVSSVWKHRHLVLGAIGIFVAVGAEVAIGSFLVNYFTQPDIAGLTPKTAAGFVSLYWAGAMIGRFAGSGLMQRVPASTVLGIAAVVVLALITTAILTSGTLSMRSMLLIGIFNSIMFPTVFTLGIAELGPLTSAGSGILMAAAVGGAIVPVLQGAIADEIGVHHSFILPALCYLYIAFYGFYGSKPVGSIVAGINHGKQAVS